MSRSVHWGRLVVFGVVAAWLVHCSSSDTVEGEGASCDATADCKQYEELHQDCRPFACVTGACTRVNAPAGTSCNGDGCDGNGDCTLSD